MPSSTCARRCAPRSRPAACPCASATSRSVPAAPTWTFLADARTNGREPHAEIFAEVAERAGRTFWLNPEPKLYWNYGDSVMSAYEEHCTAAFECWTTKHLEEFVNVVAGGRSQPES